MTYEGMTGFYCRQRLRVFLIFWFTLLVLALPSSFASAHQHAIPNQRFRENSGLNAVYDQPGSAVAWEFRTRGSISSSPLVVGGVVYIASNARRVYALNLTDGKLIWKYKALSAVMTQPLYDGSVVIISTGNAKVAAYRPMQDIILGVGINEIVGLSTTDGNAVWSLGLAGTGMPTGIIVGGVYYHIDGSGELVAVRAVSGRYLWRTNVKSTSFMTAINYQNGLFVTAGNWPNEVIAFNARGRLIWTHGFDKRFSGFSDGPLAISNGLVYGVYIQNTQSEAYVTDLKPGIQHLYALSLKTGHLIWDVALSRGIVPPFNMSSIPLAVDRLLIVGSATSPIVSAVSARTGKIRWQIKVAGAVKNGPVEQNHIVFFGVSGNFC